MDMFQSNVYNNSSQEKNLTTKICTFFGDLSSFVIAYWNENLSVKINPCVGQTAEGIRQYDYNRRIVSAIPAHKCIALAKGIEEKILPLLNSHETPTEAVSVMIPVGKNNYIIGVEYIPNTNIENPVSPADLYFSIYMSGADGKVDEGNIARYRFNKINVYMNYNIETGTPAESVQYESEFLFFYQKLSTMATVFGTAPHGIHYESLYKRHMNGGFESQVQNYQPQSLAPTSTSTAEASPVTESTVSDFPF